MPDFGAEDQAKPHFGPDQCLSIGPEEENETIQGCRVWLYTPAHRNRNTMFKIVFYTQNIDWQVC